jgi:hypothetical protein
MPSQTECNFPHRHIASTISGMTQRTLSQQLRELQRAGIVERTVYPHTPLLFWESLFGHSRSPDSPQAWFRATARTS